MQRAQRVTEQFAKRADNSCSDDAFWSDLPAEEAVYSAAEPRFAAKGNSILDLTLVKSLRGYA